MTEIMDNNTEQLQEQQTQEPTTAETEPAPAGKLFSQDEVNKIVGERLERQRKQMESSINGRIANIEAREAEIQRYETEKLRREIAEEFRIPEAMVDRIRGENRSEMRDDACKLAKSMGISLGDPSAYGCDYPAYVHREWTPANLEEAFAPGNDKHVPRPFPPRYD